MQRPSVVGEIFGYIVCLLAVVIFFMSVAGIVNNTFRVAHPMGQRAMAARWHSPESITAPPQATAGLPAGNLSPRHVRFAWNARYDAMRRLALAIVMLVLSILVFRIAFDWLNPKHVSSS